MSRRDVVLAGIACLAAFAVYANTLGHGFVWDDLIILDQRVRFYRSPLDAFLEPADLPGFPGVFRPLTFASFWLDQRFWWRDALGFHLTSVLLHALNAALVYRLARLLGCGALAALGGALLFAVHPIHTEAVAWVTGRVDVLATTFTLLAVTIAIRPPRHAVVATTAVALCAFAAAAAKEPGVVVPLLLVASGRTSRRLTVAATLGTIAYLVLRHVNARGTAELAVPTLATMALFVRAFGFYVQRLVAPVHLSAYVPVVPDGVAPWAFAGLGAIAAALGLRARRTRFATVWMLATLAPSLLVILAHISATMVAERYLYLPSVGLTLVVAIALAEPVAQKHRRITAAAVATVLVVCAVATVGRNRIWRDELTLWTDVTERTPGYSLPAANLGLALADAGRLDEAESAYRAALAGIGTPTTERDTLVNLGHVQLRRDRLDDALGLFERANAMAPHASADYGIGVVYRSRARAALARGDTQAAAADFGRAAAALEAALRINPRHYKSEFLLASVLYQSGNPTAALDHFRHVVAIAPDTDVGRDAAEAARELGAALDGAR